MKNEYRSFMEQLRDFLNSASKQGVSLDEIMGALFVMLKQSEFRYNHNLYGDKKEQEK